MKSIHTPEESGECFSHPLDARRRKRIDYKSSQRTLVFTSGVCYVPDETYGRSVKDEGQWVVANIVDQTQHI